MRMSQTNLSAEAFSSIRVPLDKASHAPGILYCSPEILDAEIQKLFKHDWLYVGREEEVENPGDFMCVRIVGETIIISRDKDGSLHAFHNMCVHRGVEVAAGCGNTRSFKCPYHGWVYDLAGNLTGAAYMKDSTDFDASRYRLQPVRIDSWRRNIFVTFNASAPSLAKYVTEFEKDFGFLRMEDCRLGNKIVLDVDCNWKFVHENLMDFYHVGVLHAKTFGAKFSWENQGVQLKDGGGISIFYSAGPPTPGAEPLLGKMPWLEDKPHSFACTGFFAPNMTLFGRIDCVRFMIAWPIGPNRSRTIIYHLFPESFFGRPDFEEKLKIYRDYQVQVLEEDRSMIESMQVAMSSPRYQPGRMSILEKALHHYLNGYLDRMFGKSSAREAAE
jgi:phenylpropionate dioxygenase-like ring-hydroxylating dioxygenase large terminal subunit